MASEIDEKVDPCRKNENDPEKSKYVTVENKKNIKQNNCIKYISTLNSCKLNLKFYGLCQILSYKY